MADEKEKFRKFINFQYVKLKRVAPVGSLISLALLLAFRVYDFVQFRFPTMIFGWIPKVYIVIPFLFCVVSITLLVIAHIVTIVFEMYRTEQLAEKILNPYSVYAFAPWEEMLFRNLWIPMYESNLSFMKDGKRKKELQKNFEKLNKWVELGYIPKDDFPAHLKKYYITTKEKRL